MKTETSRLLNKVIFEIVPKNIGKIYHYYPRNTFEAAVWLLIERNSCIQKSLIYVREDTDISEENSPILHHSAVLEVRCIQKTISEHLARLSEKYDKHMCDFREYTDYINEISVRDGLLDNLCRVSARRITDMQNTFRVIASHKDEIIEHMY